MAGRIRMEPGFCSTSGLKPDGTEGELVVKSKKSLTAKIFNFIFAQAPTPGSTRASLSAIAPEIPLGSTTASPAITTPYETISLMIHDNVDFFSGLFTSIKKHRGQESFLLLPFRVIILAMPDGRKRDALLHFIISLEEAILDAIGIAFSLSCPGDGHKYVQIIGNPPNLLDVVVNELAQEDFAPIRAKYCGKEIGMVYFTLEDEEENARQSTERPYKD